MNNPPTKPANFTRRTADFPARFRRERRFALIPLYHLLRLSDLAREGIEHSGSYQFADHLYLNQASGTGWFGRWLDRRLLNLAASKAMRSRCARARDGMRRAFEAHLYIGNPDPFRILTVPCGLPRDVREFAEGLAAGNPDRLRRVEYDGVDINPAVVAAAAAFLAGSALTEPRVREGNALDPKSYGARRYNFIASTGLGEFLSDEDLGIFYGHVYEALAPGGTFFTSAASFDKRSDALLRTFELHSRYRTRADLERVLSSKPWARVEFDQHPSALQTFVRAIKGVHTATDARPAIAALSPPGSPIRSANGAGPSDRSATPSAAH